MDYVQKRINRARERAIQNLREKDKPRLKHEKRAINRDRLYKKRLHLGRVRKK